MFEKKLIILAYVTPMGTHGFPKKCIYIYIHLCIYERRALLYTRDTKILNKVQSELQLRYSFRQNKNTPGILLIHKT